MIIYGFFYINKCNNEFIALLNTLQCDIIIHVCIYVWHSEWHIKWLLEKTYETYDLIHVLLENHI